MDKEEKHSQCDKCGTEIIDGECSCGFWYNNEETPNIAKTLEHAIMAYDSLNDNSPLTGDHHSGNCIALFKGDYETCQLVKEFIVSLKGKGDNDG